MSAPSIDRASSVESLPLRHMQKHQGAWLNRRLPLKLMEHDHETNVSGPKVFDESFNTSFNTRESFFRQKFEHKRPGKEAFCDRFTALFSVLD